MFFKKNNILFSLVSILIIGLLLMPMPIQAVEVVEDAKYVKDIAQVIVPWFNLACVLAVGISLVQLMISRDQKVVNGAYKYIGIVIATFFIFNLLGSIFEFADMTIPSGTYDYSAMINLIN